jgi:hypothetical protein
MIRDIIRAIDFYFMLRRSDALYLVLQKEKDGSYSMVESGQLFLNRKLK